MRYVRAINSDAVRVSWGMFTEIGDLFVRNAGVRSEAGGYLSLQKSRELNSYMDVNGGLDQERRIVEKLGLRKRESRGVCCCC